MKLIPPREGFALALGISASLFMASAAYPRTPCEADYHLHCKGLKPNQAASLRCLRAHRNTLSPECAEEVESHRGKATDLREACEGDRDRLCKNEKGFRSVRFCLKRNAHRLSAVCQEKVRGIAGK